MKENTKVIVKNGTLNISNSRIFGCTSLWNSIIVEPGATLIIENTYIEDGEYAIQAKPGARVEIKNCTFRDNYIAFYVADGSSALPQTVDLTQFYGNTIETQDALLAPRAGQKAYTGMLLNNVGGMVVGNETQERNRFLNLCSGIVSLNSNLNVKNTVFQDIQPAGTHLYNGYAIYADARPNQLRSLTVKGFGKSEADDPFITNCASGISANGLNATVTQCKLENVVFGLAAIQSRFRTTKFTENNIAATAAAIRLIGNTPAYIKVENNILEVDGTTATGVLVAENPIALANHAANRIAGNTINLKNGRAGILSYSGRYLEFYDNTINLELDDKQSAVQIEGLADGLVRCNKVYGLSGTLLNARGIDSKGVYSTTFSCNLLNDTKIGMSFDGMGDQSVVRGNEFTGQAVGLQIEMNGQIGSQTHQGNLWCGSFVEFGAKHLGSEFSVPQSIFTVDANDTQGQNCVYLPTILSAVPWFFDQNTTSTFQCTTTNDDACITTSPPVDIKDGISELDNKLARGSFNSTQFVTELTWTGRRHLYSRITENNIPLQNYAYVSSFYTNAANTSIEQLHETRQSIEDALSLSATDESAREGFASDIEDYLVDLSQNSQALATATSANAIEDLLDEREDILNDLAEVIEDADELGDDLYDDLLTNIGTAKTVNASVSATAIYETNEKDYNDLFLTSIEESELTTTQKEALWDIANQCPLEGGDAVYHARSLYAGIDPAATYNDLSLCNGTQPFQRPVQGMEQHTAGFQVYPNPAREVLAFNLDQPLQEAEAVLLEIFHVCGTRVYRQLHNPIDGQFIVQASDLKDGLYLCRLSLNGRDLGTRKVVVLK